MKLIDQFYSCRISGPMFGSWSLQCRLRVFQPHPEVQIVMLTDLKLKLRWLIPSLAEALVDRVAQEFDLDPARLIWVEPAAVRFHPLTIADFDQITFSACNGRAIHPQRAPITPSMVQVLLNESLQLVEKVI